LAPFEVRFETPPGAQAQVDFAQFQVVFTDEPAVTRIVWLFSLVLGFSRLIWGRFALHYMHALWFLMELQEKKSAVHWLPSWLVGSER
jgi:hypothetical protein